MSRDGELAVYSVYYYGNDDTRVQGYSIEPEAPVAETVEELREKLSLYCAALEKPGLQYAD